MKKVRLISLIALTLCFMMVFASCGGGNAIKYFENDYEEAKMISASSKIEGIGVYKSGMGNLALFVDTQELKVVYKVYNISTGAVVFTQEILNGAASAIDVDVSEIDDVAYFVVTTYNVSDNEITNAKLYSANGGAPIAETTANPEYDEFCDEVIVFGGAAYTVDKNGAIAKAFDIDDFNPLFDADASSEDYYYVFEDYSVAVYDKQGEFVNGYKVNVFVDYCEMWVLGDGNVLIQKTQALPDDAEKYDFFEDDVKWNLITEIFKVKSGTVKTVDVDFIIDNFETVKDPKAYGFKEKFDLNLANICYIVDRYIDDSTDTYAFLDNKLNVKATIDDVVKGAEWFELVADDTFLIEDEFGICHIVNKNGKVIKSVSNLDGSNEKYLWTKNAIYNYDFEKVYDLKANKCEVDYSLSSALILKKYTPDGIEYARFNDGTVTQIKAASSIATVGCILGLYYVENGGLYSYYNAAGNLVGAYYAKLAFVDSTDDGIYIVNAGIDYYRLTSAA